MALENKLGITESPELARIEEKLSKQRALELFETGALDRLEAGTFAALASIHRALFSDIYDFAGEKRTVNIAKGNFRFASVLYLDAALQNIERMPQSTFRRDRGEVCGDERCPPLSGRQRTQYADLAGWDAEKGFGSGGRLVPRG